MAETITRGDKLPTRLLEEAAEAHWKFVQAMELYEQESAERKQRWIEAYRAGFTLAQIAERSGVTPSRVYHVVAGSKPKRQRRIPEL